jgi:hypothetical protein
MQASTQQYHLIQQLEQQNSISGQSNAGTSSKGGIDNVIRFRDREY